MRRLTANVRETLGLTQGSWWGLWQTCRRRVPAKLDAAPDEIINHESQSIIEAKDVDIEPSGCPQRPVNNLRKVSSKSSRKPGIKPIVVPTPSRAHQLQAIDRKVRTHVHQTPGTGFTTGVRGLGCCCFGDWRRCNKYRLAGILVEFVPLSPDPSYSTAAMKLFSVVALLAAIASNVNALIVNTP